MMTKERDPLPTVEQCIAYLNNLGWRTVCRYKWTYAFVKDGMPPHITPMWFSLHELRDAYKGIGF